MKWLRGRTLTVVLIALALAGLVGRLLRNYLRDDPETRDLDMLTMWSWALLGVAALLVLYRWRSAIRTARLRKRYPGALILQLSSTPRLAWDIEYYRRQRTGRAGWFPRADFCTLVIDRTSIRFFTGMFRPWERVSYPTATLERVELDSEYSGAFKVACMDMHFAEGGNTAKLPVHLIRWHFGIPLLLGRTGLPDELERIRSVVKDPVRSDHLYELAREKRRPILDRVTNFL